MNLSWEQVFLYTLSLKQMEGGLLQESKINHWNVLGFYLSPSFTEHANTFISVKASNYEMEEVMVWFPQKFRITYRKAWSEGQNMNL